MLPGKGPGTEQGPGGEEPRCPAGRRGCEDTTEAPGVYFWPGMCREKLGMDLPGRKWAVVCVGMVAAVLTLLAVSFSPLVAYFLGWLWPFTGYFSSCHLRYREREYFSFIPEPLEKLDARIMLSEH